VFDDPGARFSDHILIGARIIATSNVATPSDGPYEFSAGMRAMMRRSAVACSPTPAWSAHPHVDRAADTPGINRPIAPLEGGVGAVVARKPGVAAPIGTARTAENSRIPSLRFRAASDARLSNLVRWSPLEIVGLDAPLGSKPLSKQALQGMQQTERLGVARDRRYLRAMCGCARLSSDVSEIKLVFTIRPHRRQRLDAVLAALPVLISCYRTVSKPHA